MNTHLTYTVLKLLLSVSLINHLQAWTPGVGNESSTSGFTVDRQSRNDVISFYHAIYKESEGYESRVAWTGTPGTTSAVFKEDVQRRINYYRAMAGLKADIAMTSTSEVYIKSDDPVSPSPASTTTKEEAAQAAAYMISKNGDSDHNPPEDWTDDGPEARNGAWHSLLTLGLYGPSSIDAYIYEDLSNLEVAHRRWIFYSRLLEVATGDVTSSGSDLAANALYVLSDELRVEPEFKYVAWPSEGFVPEAILFETKLWSLSYRDADFSSAVVTMFDDFGANISVTTQPVASGYGDSTLVWKPADGAIVSAESEDQVYHVTVSGILFNDVLQDYSYTVTIINPNRLLEYPTLTGSVNPPDSGAKYFFDQIEGAEAYEFDVSKLTAVTWVAGAEDGTEDLTEDQTDASYSLRSTVYKDVGSKSYRLAFAKNEYVHKSELFELTHTLIPQSAAKIEFRMRRGFMGNTSNLSVQSSVDGGVTWTTIQNYTGNSTNGPDSAFSSQSISVESVGEQTLIRFKMWAEDGVGVYSVDYATYGASCGIFIDKISFVNCDELEGWSTLYSSGDKNVLFDASTIGSSVIVGDVYTLRLRAKLGTRWFAYGASLEVTPVAAFSLSAYEIWERADYPFIGAQVDDFDGDGIPNELERVFGMDPTDVADATTVFNVDLVDGNVQLSHPIIAGSTVEAEYSYTLKADDWYPEAVSISNGVATVSKLVDAPAMYLRWKVALPSP